MEVLDLCLECKACKSECPSNVDMAKLKYEFLHHYHQAHGTPLRARVFGRADRTGRMGSALAPLANWTVRQPLVRRAMERWIGIDSRRPLPPFAGRTFRQWFRYRVPPASARGRGEVMLLADTFTNYHEPEVGKAAVRVLEAFGYRVTLPELRCCGRPMFSKGLLDQAKASAEHNVRALLEPVRRGVPLLGLEPSCLVTFRDEYRELGLGDAAEEVARSAWMLEDFLAERQGEDRSLPFRETPRPVLLHGHCHQKAVLGTGRMVTALRMVPGYAVSEVPSGCCGMAGSFGYEKEHYEISLRIGEQSLFPHLRAAPEDALIVAPGTSCRHQIRDALGREALHPAEALGLALLAR